jgi:hypothetical protein
MNGPDMMQTVTFIGGDGTVITEPPKFAISDGLRDALGLSGPGPFLLEVTRTCALGSGY